jgi:acetyltransferase
MHLFFEPKSVALIGAPRRTGAGAFNNVECLLRYGYKGTIYPVNPKAEEICGLRCYPSILGLPEVPDLTLISLRRDLVIPTFGECVERGAKRVIIISQGFADADARGKELQDEIGQMARQAGVRVLGPNTLGILNSFLPFSTAFLDLKVPRKIPAVSLIAQTGLVQAGADSFSHQGWGKAIDIGNSCDVDFVDALNYLGNDPQTQVIAVHMEGMLRGREFIEAASRVTPRKPVLVLKTGRSTAGAKAALSHTGMLAGEDEVNDVAFDRAGIIRVKAAAEMRAAIHGLLLLKEMRGPRLGVITASGAGGIMTADVCEDLGLVLSTIPEGLKKKLGEGLPDWVHVGHPIDFWPLGMIGKRYQEVFGLALTELLKSEDVDGVHAILPTLNSPMHTDLDLVDAVAGARRNGGNSKPIALWTYPHDPVIKERFESISGTACFGSLEEALGGLYFSYRHSQNAKKRPVSPKRFSVRKRSVGRLIKTGREQRHLLGEEALHLLEGFGINCVKGRTAKTWPEIKAAAEGMEYPLVLKLAGRSFLHKSEWGGVITGIGSLRALKSARTRLVENVRKRDSRIRIDAFQVQEMARGKELLLGLKRDPEYGHIILCGFGGIYTEVFRDVSREIVPIDRSRAEKMVRSLKMYPILEGVRGEAGIDPDRLMEILERLSFLAVTIPDLEELDINPLMAGEKFMAAADARILW